MKEKYIFVKFRVTVTPPTTINYPITIWCIYITICKYSFINDLNVLLLCETSLKQC